MFFFKKSYLKILCPSCEKGLRDIPGLKDLINRLLTEVDLLKLSNGANSAISKDFITNELNDCNMRATNLIMYNTPESTAVNTADKIRHGEDVSVFNDIGSIVSDSAIKPLKLIRLDKQVQANLTLHPITYTL